VEKFWALGDRVYDVAPKGPGRSPASMGDALRTNPAHATATSIYSHKGYRSVTVRGPAWLPRPRCPVILTLAELPLAGHTSVASLLTGASYPPVLTTWPTNRKRTWCAISARARHLPRLFRTMMMVSNSGCALGRFVGSGTRGGMWTFGVYIDAPSAGAPSNIPAMHAETSGVHSRDSGT
jgi:hypothetical protein